MTLCYLCLFPGTNVTYDIDMGDTVTYTLTFEHGVTSQPEAVVTGTTYIT